MSSTKIDWTCVVIGLVLLPCTPLFFVWMIAWCLWPRRGEK